MNTHKIKSNKINVLIILIATLINIGCSHEKKTVSNPISAIQKARQSLRTPLRSQRR